MKEDEKLKKLLATHLMENTSADFTKNVMQRIEAAYAAKPYATPLVKHKLLQVLMAVFVTVCLVLLALSIVVHPAELPFHFTVKLPANYFSQIIYFLVVFWIIMFSNEVYKRYFLKTVLR